MILRRIIILFLWSLSSPVWAADRYASPAGAGTTCSTGTPCSLNTALSQAVAGEHVILKNGTYQSTLNTIRSGAPGNPIVIRAENAQQAIVEPPTTWTPGNLAVSPPTQGSGQYVRILHSNITLREIVFDGDDRTYNMILVLGDEATNTTCASLIQNIIIEEIISREPQVAHLAMRCVKNAIVRHNLFTSVIATEGLYIGKHQLTVENLQFYGNTMEDAGSNSLDFKTAVLNADIHHNIVQRQHKGDIVAQDGNVTFEGRGHHFHNNIIRNGATASGSAILDYVYLWANHNIHDNVFHDMPVPHLLWYQTNPTPIATSKFENNTMCNTGTVIQKRSTSGSSSTPDGLTQSGNLVNQAQAVCDAEVTRIINEMATLPRWDDGLVIDAPNALTVVSITD